MVTGEPSVEELLAEPIIRRLMASDRVSMGELERLLARVRERLDEERGRRTGLRPARATSS